MDKKSNVPKKLSLSLGNKLHRKRRNDSPLREVTAATATATSNETIETNCANATVTIIDSPPLCSPPVISECRTPPSNHRRKSIICLDDSIDSSPRLLDCSFSPSCLFSQTLVSDSPEVNWRWTRRCAIENNAAMQLSTDIEERLEEASAARALAASRKERRKKLLSANDNRRKQQEQEMRRAQQTRAYEQLTERCARLHKQFEDVNVAEPQQVLVEQMSTRSSMKNHHSPLSSNAIASTSESASNISSKKENKADLFSTKTKSLAASTMRSTVNSKQPSAVAIAVKKMEIPEPAISELDDFFNDSAADDFLLAATQQWESEVISHTQQIVKNETKIPNIPVSAANVSNHNDTNVTATTTPKSSHKDKRSSFYMKFLEDEDESIDEWFTALDEAEREATQPKKPRTSLQRYKSMPDKTTTTCTPTNNSKPKSSIANGGALGQTAVVVTPTSSHIKRYASSHALSPVARSKLFGNRK